jgi:H+/Cl- antiporter ClcA
MSKNGSFIFSRKNYSLILIAIGLLVMGFLLMTGKGNAGGTAFNKDIYSFRRITLSPLVLLSGYAMMIYAIMADRGKPKQNGNGHSQSRKI